MDLYLELNGSRTDEEQWMAVPYVDVHGVKSQVVEKQMLLSGSQEIGVYSELYLQPWSA